MIYRNYGKTGKKVSMLGFGGMRFGQIDKTDQCVEMMLTAAKGGVNYFDTAPGYFETKGETVFGEAFSEFKRRNIPFYCATKTMKSSEKPIRKEIEKQLKRLRIEAIDFYHMWCVSSLKQWHERKRNGVLKTFQKLKDEGLIHHICVSSHLIGEEIRELLGEGIFEGVLFGYSAYNFNTRQAAFEAISGHDLGCVVMNPLGGGIIPDNPKLFDFIRLRSDKTVVAAALRFVFSHKKITAALVGFKNKSEVQEGLKAVENYHEMSEREMETIKSQISDSFEGLCTGCRYCDHCPESIPVPKLMEAFNHKRLYGTDKAMLERLKWHWQVQALGAEKCVACGQCEEACTQHLPIIERLAEIASIARKSKSEHQQNRRSDKLDSLSIRAKPNS
jgi:predicted aldo/keto reductase-like oxidoreductase